MRPAVSPGHLLRAKGLRSPRKHLHRLLLAKVDLRARVRRTVSWRGGGPWVGEGSEPAVLVQPAVCASQLRDLEQMT